MQRKESATLRHASTPDLLASPEYSSKARNAHDQGVCTLGVVVGTNVRTSDIRVLSALGMGLDEKAVEAVKRWTFKPAWKTANPSEQKSPSK